LADCPQIQVVLYGALELRCVFDGHDAIMRRQLCERRQTGIRECRFPAACRSNDKDVLFLTHSGADDVSVRASTDRAVEIVATAQTIPRITLRCKNFGFFVFFQREDAFWSQADREHRASYNRRNDAFEPAAVEW